MCVYLYITGGGFGGKEGKLNLVCAPTAVAAARSVKQGG